MARMDVMVVASGGGHWTQMLRVRQALDGFGTVYVGVKAMYAADVVPARFHAVRDVSRLHRWNLLLTVPKLLWLLLRYRPKVVLTTGSAPGMLALRLAKPLGAKCIWIDSIANVEALSMSGQKAGAVADLWLTQWEHLAREGGPRYEGSVL